MAQMSVAGVPLWDAPLYALLDLDCTATATLRFATASFLRYRFGAAVVGDELLDAVTLQEGDWHAVLDDRCTLLPLRNALLASLGSVQDLPGRIAGGGVAVVLAVASEGEFLIPWQQRSEHVGDGAGLFAVVPLAYHQPAVGGSEECRPYWTVLREVYEECLGGQHAEPAPPELSFDWYLEESESVRYLHEHESGVAITLNGIGLNSFNGNYELAAGVTVEDEAFFSRFGGLFRGNWEVGRWTMLRTKDKAALTAALSRPDHMLESRFALAQSLVALRKRYPERVADVDLQVGTA